VEDAFSVALQLGGRCRDSER